MTLYTKDTGDNFLYSEQRLSKMPSSRVKQALVSFILIVVTTKQHFLYGRKFGKGLFGILIVDGEFVGGRTFGRGILFWRIVH